MDPAAALPKEAAAGAHDTHMRSHATRTPTHSGAHTTVLDLPIVTCVRRVSPSVATLAGRLSNLRRRPCPILRGGGATREARSG